MIDIEALLNKYFEGETTCEEERRLRRFFTEGLIPKHLQMYRPMFAYFEAERKEHVQASATTVRPERRKRTFSYYMTYGLGVAAATLLLVLSIRHLSPEPASYVVIDGKQYTDARLIREQAKAAFRTVSLDEEEVFATLFEE